MTPFEFNSNGGRAIFGPGSSLAARREVERQGCRRILVLSTLHQRLQADAVAEPLGRLVGAVFYGAAMHTPVEVTDRALDVYRRTGADGILAIGGGTTTGLGKAIAYRTGAKQIVVATTYAGSEVTPILGQTENAVKTTVRDARVLPDCVIYDPDLTLDLPVATSVNSGMNALAHAVEGLYAWNANPITSLMAVEGVRAMQAALPRIVAEPRNGEARGDALYGAWLCGTVLGTVGMALHHKLCHVLGGSFGLPHAETHAVVLPYAVAFNAQAARRQLAPLASIFGEDLAAGIKSFADSIGAPSSLRALGLGEPDLDEAARIAAHNSYPNPRPIEADGIRRLLAAAWAGNPPETCHDGDLA